MRARQRGLGGGRGGIACAANCAASAKRARKRKGGLGREKKGALFPASLPVLRFLRRLRREDKEEEGGEKERAGRKRGIGSH